MFHCVQVAKCFIVYRLLRKRCSAKRSSSMVTDSMATTDTDIDDRRHYQETIITGRQLAVGVDGTTRFVDASSLQTHISNIETNDARPSRSYFLVQQRRRLDASNNVEDGRRRRERAASIQSDVAPGSQRVSIDVGQQAVIYVNGKVDIGGGNLVRRSNIVDDSSSSSSTSDDDEDRISGYDRCRPSNAYAEPDDDDISPGSDRTQGYVLADHRGAAAAAGGINLQETGNYSVIRDDDDSRTSAVSDPYASVDGGDDLLPSGGLLESGNYSVIRGEPLSDEYSLKYTSMAGGAVPSGVFDNHHHDLTRPDRAPNNIRLPPLMISGNLDVKCEAEGVYSDIPDGEDRSTGSFKYISLCGSDFSTMSAVYDDASYANQNDLHEDFAKATTTTATKASDFDVYAEIESIPYVNAGDLVDELKESLKQRSRSDNRKNSSGGRSGFSGCKDGFTGTPNSSSGNQNDTHASENDQFANRKDSSNRNCSISIGNQHDFSANRIDSSGGRKDKGNWKSSSSVGNRPNAHLASHSCKSDRRPTKTTTARSLEVIESAAEEEEQPVDVEIGYETMEGKHRQMNYINISTRTSTVSHCYTPLPSSDSSLDYCGMNPLKDHNKHEIYAERQPSDDTDSNSDASDDDREDMWITTGSPSAASRQPTDVSGSGGTAKSGPVVAAKPAVPVKPRFRIPSYDNAIYYENI